MCKNERDVVAALSRTSGYKQTGHTVPKKRLMTLWNNCFVSTQESDKLKDFFYRQLSSKKYWLIVYMDRRCASLVRFYIQAFGAPRGNEIEVVSNSALPGMSHRLREQRADGKKILLVDDILIHGRAVQKIWRYMVETCGVPATEIDIDIYGYCVSTSKCLDDDVKRRILPARMLEQRTWHTLSSQIVKLVYASGFPHAAFVMCYGKFLPGFEKLSSLLNSSQNVPYYVDLSSTDCVERGVWIPEKWPLNTIVSKASMRAVYSKETERLSLIPFVITRPVKADKLPELLESLAGTLPETCESLKCALKYSIPLEMEHLDTAKNALVEYKMRLLNCVLSIWFGALFCKEYLSDSARKDLAIDTEILRYSFSSDIAVGFEELERAAGEGWEWADDRLCRDVIFSSDIWECIEEDERKISCDQLNCAIERNKETPEWLWFDYFAQSGENDEIRAQNRKERYLGQPEVYLEQCISDKKDKRELFAYLIDAWDRGAAALTYHSKSGVCEAYSAAGEYSFQYYLRRFGSQIGEIRRIASAVWYDKEYEGALIDAIQENQKDRVSNFIEGQEERIKIALKHFLDVYGEEIFYWDANLM